MRFERVERVERVVFGGLDRGGTTQILTFNVVLGA